MWGQQSVPFYSEVAYISSTWSRVVVCGEAALASAVDEEVGDILFVGRGRGRLAGGSLASRPSLSASRLAGPAMVTSPIPVIVHGAGIVLARVDVGHARRVVGEVFVTCAHVHFFAGLSSL